MRNPPSAFLKRHLRDCCGERRLALLSYQSAIRIRRKRLRPVRGDRHQRFGAASSRARVAVAQTAWSPLVHHWHPRRPANPNKAGNAFDAALRTCGRQTLVGTKRLVSAGDVFFCHRVGGEGKKAHRVYNATDGRPAVLHPEHLWQIAASKNLPAACIHSATVPGAVDGWDVFAQTRGHHDVRHLEPAATLLTEFGITELHPQ